MQISVRMRLFSIDRSAYRPIRLNEVQCIQKWYSCIFISFNGELYICIKGIQMLMKVINICFLYSSDSIFNITIIHSWTISISIQCFHLQVSHNKIRNHNRHWRAHCSAMNLLVKNKLTRKTIYLIWNKPGLSILYNVWIVRGNGS